MDSLSQRDSLLHDHQEAKKPGTVLAEVENRSRQPEREPFFSVATLLDGRSAWESVFENARPFKSR